MRPTLRHWAVLFSVIGLVLAADQLTKLYIESALAPGQTVIPIPALGDYFRIVRSHNTGAAFGFLPDAGWLFSIIAVGGSAHFRQGDSSVVATVNDPYLPEGEWHELPVFDGDQWSYVSIISATGAGTIAAQIVERQ